VLLKKLLGALKINDRLINVPSVPSVPFIKEEGKSCGIRKEASIYSYIIGGKMTQPVYENLWHYSEQFSRDPLQRSGPLTMALCRKRNPEIDALLDR
jgi:hypothetical protein